MNTHRILSTAFAVMAISTGTSAALAETNNSRPSPDAKANEAPSTSPPVVSTSAPAQKIGGTSTIANWPKRAAGVVAGIVIGIPVCAVRQPLHEEKYGISQTAGAKTRPRKTIPWAVIYSPFAVVSGLIEAPFYAFNNSLINYDKPFSKAQFSITDREEPLNVDPIKGTSDR